MSGTTVGGMISTFTQLREWVATAHLAHQPVSDHLCSCGWEVPVKLGATMAEHLEWGPLRDLGEILESGVGSDPMMSWAEELAHAYACIDARDEAEFV